MKYTIYQRYEYGTVEGIKWTKWFRLISSPITDSEKELKDLLKVKKANGKDIEKRTHLKIEFKIDEYDDSTLINYTKIPVPMNEWFKPYKKNVDPNTPSKKRGRPKKNIEETK